MAVDGDRIEFLKRDYSQGFTGFVGLRATDAGDGWFEAAVDLRPELLQQDGLAHAGVVATLADHTSGYAAYTTVDQESRILTIEFKINFLKPGAGDRLRCRAEIISRGRLIIVGESKVYAEWDGGGKLVSKATVTMTAVPADRLAR